MELKAIKDLVYNFESQKYLLHALYMRLSGATSTSAHRASTQRGSSSKTLAVDVVKHSGGAIGSDPGIL